MPTETVYGLAGDASSEASVTRIFEAKRRPANDPLIVHAASADRAREAAREWPAAAQRLAEAFWPGPLSIVVPRSALVAEAASGGLDTVALRCPAHPVARALIERSGRLLAAPSANIFTRLSPSHAEDVDPDIARMAAMILDGGPCTVGIESTVVSVMEGIIRVLRPGDVSISQIRGLLGDRFGEVVEGPGPADPAHVSPGLFKRHYAPKVKTVLCSVVQSPFALLYGSAPSQGTQIAMPDDPAAYARDLYAALHRLEMMGADLIEIERPPHGPEWAAVWDRITKATSD